MRTDASAHGLDGGEALEHALGELRDVVLAKVAATVIDGTMHGSRTAMRGPAGRTATARSAPRPCCCAGCCGQSEQCRTVREWSAHGVEEGEAVEGITVDGGDAVVLQQPATAWAAGTPAGAADSVRSEVRGARTEPGRTVSVLLLRSLLARESSSTWVAPNLRTASAG